MALYHVAITAETGPETYGTKEFWQYKFSRGIRAVSRKHALDKAIAYAQTIPGYVDRRETGQHMCVDASIIDYK